MITYKSYDMIRASTTKTVTIFIVNQLIQKYLLKINIEEFDIGWTQAAIATIAGFMIHDLFTYRLNEIITNRLNLKSDMSKAILKDILYFGTMLVSKELILSYIQNRELLLNRFKNIGITLLGFVFYNIIFSKHTNKLSSKMSMNRENIGFTSTIATVTDTSKTALAILISDFLPDYAIDLSTLPTIFALAFSIPIYHYLTGPIVGVGKSREDSKK